jgi:hypothetical protein
MLVKFFHHGLGEADSAVRYLTATRPVAYLAGARDKKGVPRDPAPVVVRGDAELTRRLINQLGDRRYRYVSGVLSFRELITPEVEQRIIDRFEAAAFAGLEGGQFDCVWIRHAHNKRSELHFLTPRCELSTGKSLNIRPPGKRSEELFDTFRKLVNRDFNLKDPDRSVARLSETEVTALRRKLERLSAARATYNRGRFPAPSAAVPSPTPPIPMKTELDLLTEALGKLEREHLTRNREIEARLADLTGRLEQWAQQLSSVRAQLSALASLLDSWRRGGPPR